MRAMRRVATTAGLLSLALLPMAAAGTAESSVVASAPVAVVQPFSLNEPPVGARRHVRLAEPGLLLLIGAGLIGMGSIVRKTATSGTTKTKVR